MSETADWRQSRSRRFQVAAIAALWSPIIAALGRTYRWQIEGREHLDTLEREGRVPIIAFWHGRILPGMIFFRDRGIVVITSENFDGEWIARIIERFGYGTARGSSSRGAVKALVQLRRDLEQGRPTAFTVDGPRGPAHRVQPGAIWLAKASGCPILPFHAEARGYWESRSWDRTQVPKPFTRVTLCIGPPQYVAAAASDVDLEAARVTLERTLLSLMDRATTLARTP